MLGRESEPQSEQQRTNTWFVYNASSTVIVFVHGIFSNCESCWTSGQTEQSPKVYWPELIAQDHRLSRPSIYLGGFYTSPSAEDFGVQDCADQLWTHLSTPQHDQLPAPLRKPNILFVCHSTGGIVVRRMLVQHREAFNDKAIGLLLYASPSWGSKLASWAGFASWILNAELARALRWGNAELRQLDHDFRAYLAKVTNVRGFEAYENHFILRWGPIGWLSMLARLRVVQGDSAGRYFEAVQLARTDHFTTVKPDSLGHPAHQCLVDFFLSRFGQIAHAELEVTLRVALEAMAESCVRHRQPHTRAAILETLLNGECALCLDRAMGEGSAAALLESLRHHRLGASGQAPTGSHVVWEEITEIREAISQVKQGGEVAQQHLFHALLRGDSKAGSGLRDRLGEKLDSMLQCLRSQGATPLVATSYGLPVG